MSTSVQEPVEKAKLVVEEPPKWEMPYVSVGMLVQHVSSDQNSAPCAAVVTAVHDMSLTLFVFPAEWPVGKSYSGVRHITDPRPISVHVKEQIGFWRYVPGGFLPKKPQGK